MNLVKFNLSDFVFQRMFLAYRSRFGDIYATTSAMNTTRVKAIKTIIQPKMLVKFRFHALKQQERDINQSLNQLF